MERDPHIKIRSASLKDEAFILSLIPRLTAFGPPPWRDVEAMTEYDSKVISDNLHHPSSNTAIFIAEDENQTPLGLIHLFDGSDYYYTEKQSHISDLIVAKEGEGRGIGQLLLTKGEEWARQQGSSWLTLSVFAQNQRARWLYERNGFGEDMIRYVKVL